MKTTKKIEILQSKIEDCEGYLEVVSLSQYWNEYNFLIELYLEEIARLEKLICPRCAENDIEDDRDVCHPCYCQQEHADYADGLGYDKLAVEEIL